MPSVGVSFHEALIAQGNKPLKVKDSILNARTAALNIAFANRAAGQPVQLRANDDNGPSGGIVVGRLDRIVWESSES